MNAQSRLQSEDRKRLNMFRSDVHRKLATRRVQRSGDLERFFRPLESESLNNPVSPIGGVT